MIGSSGTVMIGHFWPATLRYLLDAVTSGGKSRN